MSTHSSIEAPRVEFAFRDPKERMSPNERCWCGSGKKWKKCHKDREQQAPLNIWKHVAETREKFRAGRCSHPEAAPNKCEGTPIKSHTVQRAGGLSAIAEGGHVISIKLAFENIFKNSGKLIPEKIGVRFASTFSGFCGRHDSELFRPLEHGSVDFTAENFFLLSLRSIAYELITKECALAVISAQREMDRGTPFSTQAAIQNQLAIYEQGTLIGLNDAKLWKNRYDEIFRARSFEEFHYYAVVFDGIMPIVGSGAFYPEVDFDGEELQRLGRENQAYEHIAINLTSLENKTIVVAGWLGDDGGPASVFAKSLRKAIGREGVEAVVRLCFEHLENIYFKPTWWSSLGSKQDWLLERCFSGGPSKLRDNRCLISDGHEFVSPLVVRGEYWSSL